MFPGGEGGPARFEMWTWVCTISALAAFAANSILCRLALGRSLIDAASFSTVRLASGAILLLLLSFPTRSRPFRVGGTWTSATMLFLYAAPFSFAYLDLSAGTGALVLFGSVQITMILSAIASGERPHPLQWIGLLLALSGLVSLLLPGLTAPSPRGLLLMTIAGTSWGFYSLMGRGSADPLRETAGNFARSVPMALLVSAASLGRSHGSPGGIVLAATSGALASGVGYSLWYAALPSLSATRAAGVQLAVPLLAAAGGVVILSETISPRLLGAAVLILGGVGLVLLGRERLARPKSR